METNLTYLHSETVEKDGLSFLLQKHWDESQELDSHLTDTYVSQSDFVYHEKTMNTITEQNQMDNLSLFLRNYSKE